MPVNPGTPTTTVEPAEQPLRFPHLPPQHPANRRHPGMPPRPPPVSPPEPTK